jgi:uncharacterized protein (DUF488 family)
MKETSRTFFTIGHSTRPIAEFVLLLRSADVAQLADVRTLPRSRTNPQYNGAELARSLSQSRIGYEHLAALGGRRPQQPAVSPAANAFWENQSFHNYADYAMTEVFRSVLTRLRESARERPCAVMCAEALWWRCHRRIIADYLIHAGETVFHILGKDVEAARMTSAARPGPDGTLIYPAEG